MLNPIYKAIGLSARRCLLGRSGAQPRARDHPADVRRHARPLPADGEAGALDDLDAKGSTRDQASAAEVQERQAEAERGDPQVLPGEQDQSAGGMSSSRHAVPDLHLALPRAAQRAGERSQDGPVQPPLRRHLRQGGGGHREVPEAPQGSALPRHGPVEVALERAHGQHRLGAAVCDQHSPDHRDRLVPGPPDDGPHRRTTRTPAP